MPLFGPPNVEKLKATRDVPAIAKALQHKDGAIRAAAARALGSLQETAAIESLVPLLDDPDSDVSQAAAETLIHLGWNPDDEESRAALLVASRDVDGLARLGPAGVAPLVELLKREARRAPGEDVGAAAGFNPNDPEGEWRVRVGRPDSADPRWAIIDALRANSVQSVEALVEALDDEDESVDHATWALVEIGGPALKPLLHHCLAGHSRDGSFHTGVVGAIGAIAKSSRERGGAGLVPCLREYSGEVDLGFVSRLAGLAEESAEFEAWAATIETKPSVSTPRAEKQIDRPRATVWETFIDTATWEKWYGSSPQLDPDWQKGAVVRWEGSDPWEVADFVPLERVALASNAGWTTTVWTFSDADNGSTIVVYELVFAPQLTPTDPQSIPVQLEEVLSRLKKVVETKVGAE